MSFPPLFPLLRHPANDVHDADFPEGGPAASAAARTPRDRQQQHFLSRLGARIRQAFRGPPTRIDVRPPAPITMTGVQAKHRAWCHAGRPATGETMTAFLDAGWTFLNLHSRRESRRQKAETETVNRLLDDLRAVWAANRLASRRSLPGRLLARLTACLPAACWRGVRKKRAHARAADRVRERWLSSPASRADVAT
ncbi:hypothetical protein [Roseateles sp. L2-2]|uniref:hypothetical protein n=1 Tax=Roseateles TaxID=93681 RepID=UPI003D35E1B6